MAKDKKVTIILCCIGLIGIAGLHRFYSKKYVSGIIWLLTLGIFGIGTIIDLVLLVTKNKMFLD